MFFVVKRTPIYYVDYLGRKREDIQSVTSLENFLQLILCVYVYLQLSVHSCLLVIPSIKMLAPGEQGLILFFFVSTILSTVPGTQYNYPFHTSSFPIEVQRITDQHEKLNGNFGDVSQKPQMTQKRFRNSEMYKIYHQYYITSACFIFFNAVIIQTSLVQRESQKFLCRFSTSWGHSYS